VNHTSMTGIINTYIVHFENSVRTQLVYCVVTQDGSTMNIMKPASCKACGW
jgi:hypothetical protein